MGAKVKTVHEASTGKLNSALAGLTGPVEAMDPVVVSEELRTVQSHLAVLSDLAMGSGRADMGRLSLDGEQLSIVIADLAKRCSNVVDQIDHMTVVLAKMPASSAPAR